MIRLGRLLHEVTSGVMQRGSRTLLTVLGIAIGVASFVTVLGVTASANAQISDTFLRADATRITVTPEGSRLPRDAAARALRIRGAQAAASSWPITEAATRLPESVTGGSSGSGTGGAAAGVAGGAQLESVQVQAVDVGYWRLLNARLREGRVFDAALAGQPVAVLGERAAAALGIAGLVDGAEGQPAVMIGGRAFTVVGIVDKVAGAPVALSAVSIPADYAREQLGEPGRSETLVVQAQRGGAQVVAEQLALAINPSAPDSLRVVAPPPPTVVRDRVSAENQALFYALAGICLLVSGVGIANVTLLGVLARRHEIGLRRSLGALPRHIAAQFVLEAAVRGLLGGAVGTALAVLLVTGICLAARWSVVMEPASVLIGPLLGLTVGVLAGVYPAVRATRVEPIEAFRA